MKEDLTALESVSEGLAQAVERVAASTVLVNARRRIPASGVVWDASGLIVAADHVIEREEDIRVRLPDDREVAATLVGRDPGSDIAVLRLQANGLVPAERAPQDATKVGHLVLAVGRPSRGGPQASIGVVSTVGGSWQTVRGGEVSGYVQTDTVFFPGFSGGPLADSRGRVIGINTSRFGQDRGLTIPSAAVATIVDKLVKSGRISRPYLGIGSQTARLPEGLSAKIAGQETGLLVMSVEPNSPAHNAGLFMGDILVGIDGEPLRSTDDLLAALREERIGKAVRLSVLRGGEPQQLSATLVERT